MESKKANRNYETLRIELFESMKKEWKEAEEMKPENR
jgi:hypothetical protein